MFSIPFVKILLFEIKDLKHRDDKIFIFEETSFPFKSFLGFFSAKHEFCAYLRTSENFLPECSISVIV